MGKNLSLIGALLAMLGWILMPLLVKPESIKKNIYGILEKYKDEEELSEEDDEKLTKHVTKSMQIIVICSRITILGAVIMLLGVIASFIGI